MKNKKTLYILLPLVAIVWGTIIYKIMAATDGNDDPIPLVTKTATDPNSLIALDSFSIEANYRDPFMGRPHSNNKRIVNKKVIKKNPREKKKAIDWSFIKYNGTMTNQNTNKRVALVSINGSSHLMNVGDLLNEVRLLSVKEDSIYVDFNNKKKYIRK